MIPPPAHLSFIFRLNPFLASASLSYAFLSNRISSTFSFSVHLPSHTHLDGYQTDAPRVTRPFRWCCSSWFPSPWHLGLILNSQPWCIIPAELQPLRDASPSGFGGGAMLDSWRRLQRDWKIVYGPLRCLGKKGGRGEEGKSIIKAEVVDRRWKCLKDIYG